MDADLKVTAIDTKTEWMAWAALADNKFSDKLIRQAKDPAPFNNIDAGEDVFAVESHAHTCYNCGGVGHYRHQCPSKPGTGRGNRGRGRSRPYNPSSGRSSFNPRGRGDLRGGWRSNNNYCSSQADANPISLFRPDTAGSYVPFDPSIVNMVDYGDDEYGEEYDDQYLLDEDSLPGEIKDFHYDCLLSLERGKKLTVPISIGNKTTTGLIDCGASIVLVRPEFKSKTIRTGHCPVRYGNGATELLSERTLLRLCIDGVCYKIWAWVAKDLPYDIVLGNEFLAGRASIDLVNYVIKFIPTEEDEIAFSCETPATSSSVYAKYAIEKRDRDIAAIKSKVSDLNLRKTIIEFIWKFWEQNKDSWNPCSFPAYRIILKEGTYYDFVRRNCFTEQSEFDWIQLKLVRLNKRHKPWSEVAKDATMYHLFGRRDAI